MPNHAKIEVDNVSFVYNAGSPFEKKALSNISMTVYEGEFIGLIGHTGSGKSTLIKQLNALFKPTSGVIKFEGKNIFSQEISKKTIRQKVGLVFQYPEHQLFEMTVLKDVCFGPLNMGFSEEEAQKVAKEALKLVGVSEEDYEKSPFELSGGQKRRVAIAGVLAMKPSVLILDEPTAGLDPYGRESLLNVLKNMKENGLTIMLVSHSMEDIARFADRIFVMEKGEIILSGTPAEVFSHAKKLESVGLAAPETSYLIEALRQKGFDLSPYIYTTEQATEAIFALISGKEGQK